MIEGGDFNAHIAAGGEILDELMEGISLNKSRLDTKMVRCSRGSVLLNFMESNSLFCLNGRSTGDTPGKITYLAATGSSTVDFIWVNIFALHLVLDFEVCLLATSSDHFPIKGTFDVSLDRPP